MSRNDDRSAVSCSPWLYPVHVRWRTELVRSISAVVMPRVAQPYPPTSRFLPVTAPVRIVGPLNISIRELAGGPLVWAPPHLRTAPHSSGTKTSPQAALHHATDRPPKSEVAVRLPARPRQSL